MGEYEIYLEYQLMQVKKSERKFLRYDLSKPGIEEIEIKLHERGTIIIEGSSLKDLFESIRNENINTVIDPGKKGVKKIKVFIPDNDFPALLEAQTEN